MRLNPHLPFNGQCEAAFKFYQQCLGGEIVVMLTYGDSPEAARTPPESAREDHPRHARPGR